MKYLCLVYLGSRSCTPCRTGSAWPAATASARRRARRRRGAPAGRDRHDRPRAERPDVVTDGPFAETKEQLAGFYLVEARDLNDAIQIAAKIPPGARGQRRSAADSRAAP